jgi:hypothetical protein
MRKLTDQPKLRLDRDGLRGATDPVGGAIRPPNMSIRDGTFAVGDVHGDIQADGDQMLGRLWGDSGTQGLDVEITASIRRWIRWQAGLWW